jgi:hypothetical protein
MKQEHSCNRLALQSRLRLQIRRISQQPLDCRNQCKDPKAQPTGLVLQNSYLSPYVPLLGIEPRKLGLEVPAEYPTLEADPTGILSALPFRSVSRGLALRSRTFYFRALYNFSNIDLPPRSHEGEQ